MVIAESEVERSKGALLVCELDEKEAARAAAELPAKLELVRAGESVATAFEEYEIARSSGGDLSETEKTIKQT